MSKLKKKNSKKSKLAGQSAAAALAGTLLLADDASAQSSSFTTNLASIQGIQGATLQADGSLLIQTADGQTLTIPAGQFSAQNGQFFIGDNVVQQILDGGTSNGALLGLGAIAVAGAVVALASGGGDDDPAPAPVVELPPEPEAPVLEAGPTDGDDNLEGTDGDDTIDGLGGNDTISGLAGNDTLTGAGGNDTLTGGAGDDVLLGSGGTDIIDGGEGIDTNSFEGIGAGVTATVAADGSGTADYGMVSETFTSIENLTGTDNNDVLIATGAAANTLIGGAGDDILAGGGGTDIIDGGEGIDTNSFEGIGLGVTATVAADGSGTADYGMVSETFTGIENLTGTDNNDVLIATGAAANTLIGGAGDDILAGGGGTDIIDGGEGIDTNSFEGIGAGVTATVAADGSGTADYGMVSETFTGIENLTGTDNNDVLIATGAAANTIFGGAGDDIIAGGGGTDILDGGEGNDTNSFQGIAGDVTASLVSGTASYGMVNETFANFENLTGGSGNDTLTGDANANVLDGGDGFDTVTFLDVADNITVTSNDDGTFTAVSALDGTNVLTNVESLLDSTGAVIDFPANVLADGTSDLSGSGAAPTQFTLLEGSNTISGTVVNAQGTGTATTRDVDIFTVTVPEDFTLSEVNITNFNSVDNVGFSAVVEGNTFPVDFASNGLDSSDFLGLALFGDNNDLLADLAAGLGTSFLGFDPAQGLVGGPGGTSYTFLVQQNGDSPIEYTFDFVLEATVPSSVSAKTDNVFTSAELDDGFVADTSEAVDTADFASPSFEDISETSNADLADIFEIA